MYFFLSARLPYTFPLHPDELISIPSLSHSAPSLYSPSMTDGVRKNTFLSSFLKNLHLISPETFPGLLHWVIVADRWRTVVIHTD
jgi:hypothetical protein